MKSCKHERNAILLLVQTVKESFSCSQSTSNITLHDCNMSGDKI